MDLHTEAERQLAELISMPTITADVVANDMAVKYCEAYLRERGMHCTLHHYDGRLSLTASTRPDNDKTPTVLLNAHIDIAPADEAMFRLHADAEKLYGRGVFDMKFSIAGYLELVNTLYKEGTLADYDFGVMITSDEETGGFGAGHLAQAGYQPKIVIMPDSAASGWNIEKVAKGFWRFNLIAEGREGHGARPWEGESASFKLIQILHDIKQLFNEHGPDTDTLNIGVIQGGKAYNLIPSHMMASLEIRVLSVKAQEDLLRRILAMCKQYGVKYEEFVFMKPVVANLDYPLTAQYMDVVEHVTGHRPESVISAAGSDAPHFAEVGVECIVSCPAGGGHHTANEWIDRKQFAQFVPVLREFLERTARR